MIDKTNALIETVEEKTTRDGVPYVQLHLRFDRSGKVSRINLFDEALSTFQRSIEDIRNNGNRCGIFYKGDWENKAGSWIVWSGLKRETTESTN